MGRTPLPTAPQVQESRLRTRRTDPVHFFGERPNSQRALQAASEVLSGTISNRSAQERHMVSVDSLKYYTGKLLEQGMPDLRKAALSALSSPISTVYPSKSSECSSTFVTAWDDYCQAYMEAGHLVPQMGKRKAAAIVSQKYQVTVSPSTALRASMSPGMPPNKCGVATLIPSNVEHKLESMCLALRELMLLVFRFMTINDLNVVISGTAIAAKLKDKEVRRHWYYNWLGRCRRLKTGNIRPLEVTRGKWSTPENVLTHYNMVRDKLLELKLAVPNAGYDPKLPFSEEIKITRPDRVGSMDETRLTNDTTDPCKAKANRVAIAAKGDSGECLVNKGGGDGTGIGGTTADLLDFPGFFIFSKNILHAGEQNCDVAPENIPVCRRMDPQSPGQPLPARFWANNKGGVTGDLGVRYIRGCVEPAMAGLSPDNPGLLIMDGHGSHFTLELIDYCRSIGLHIVLRPPHTTHILQGEDVQHFSVFKKSTSSRRCSQWHPG